MGPIIRTATNPIRSYPPPGSVSTLTEQALDLDQSSGWMAGVPPWPGRDACARARRQILHDRPRLSGPLSGRRRSPRWRHGGDGSHERQKAACWRGAQTNSTNQQDVERDKYPVMDRYCSPIGLTSSFDPVQIHFDRPLHQTGACHQTMTSIPCTFCPPDTFASLITIPAPQVTSARPANARSTFKVHQRHTYRPFTSTRTHAAPAAAAPQRRLLRRPAASADARRQRRSPALPAARPLLRRFEWIAQNYLAPIQTNQIRTRRRLPRSASA